MSFLSHCILISRGFFGNGIVHAHAMTQNVTWPAIVFRGTEHSNSNPLLKSR